MKQTNFAGKSIPVNFSMMSVRDLRITLQIIEEKFSEAKKEGGETLKGDNTADITVPLRHLAEALHVDYTVSIEFGKIKKTLKEIRIHVDALLEFEKKFFKEENRSINGEAKKKTGRSLSLLNATGTEGAWPSS